jgi:hypothetical protein
MNVEVSAVRSLNMNIDKLRSLVKQDESAKRIFDMWAGRYRNRDFIKLKRFKRTLRERSLFLKDTDIMRTLNVLAEENAGEIVYRNNRPFGFKWRVPLKALATSVLEAPQLTENRDRGPKAETIKVESIKPQRPKCVLLAIRLHNGNIFKLQLDDSWTKEDIDTIAKSLKSL